MTMHSDDTQSAPRNNSPARAPLTEQELPAVACCLAEADPNPGTVWEAWERYGVALLLGCRFDAVRVPAEQVHTADWDGPAERLTTGTYLGVPRPGHATTLSRWVVLPPYPGALCDTQHVRTLLAA
ncbi:hypothetical protein AB0938_38995, partial [Streptomyces sp. NPDC047071]